MQTYADSTPHSTLGTTVIKAATSPIDSIPDKVRMTAYKMGHCLAVEFNLSGGLTHNNEKIPVMSSI